MAAIGHHELRAITAPEVLEGGNVKETDDRHQHHCRQNGLGQGSKQVREEQTTTNMIPAAMPPDSGVRAPPPSLTRD